MAQRPWYYDVLEQTDPEFLKLYAAERDFIMQDGALPAKFKVLISMVIDALLAHEDGVKVIADRARSLGASEEEIREALRVGYLYGGTPALVTGMSAYKK